MAFGRSNSLSINTGASNALLRSAAIFMPGALTIALAPSGNNQATATTQPGSASLFGASTAQPQQPSAFGSTATSQTQSGGLFGSAPASQPQQTGGLFGNSNAASQPQTGSLFGNNNAASQPQQTGGLFGNTASQPAGTSLFGSNTQQSQPQQSTGGLFGSTLGQNQTSGQQQQQGAAAGGGLFGNLGQSQTQPQQQQSGGMFGTLGQNKPASTSLFGGSIAQQPANNNQQQPSLFGSSLLNPNGSTTIPLAGSLTMGQGNTSQNTVPGTKIDVSNIRPTTRFSDLHDDLKKQMENMDTFIRLQESYCSQCEALVPMHATNVDSIPPDVDLITGKIETVELALENDSRAIESAKSLVKREAVDLMRCARVIENLALPPAYHYGPTVANASRNRSTTSGTDDGSYDVDLTGYFVRQADTMQKTLDTYTSHLAEIENHLRVIESSTIQQAQLLAAQRAGGRGGNGQDTVRELADTLRGFENGILGAASLVGSCREGVNELILGKVGGDVRDGAGYGARRTVRF
ncbi:hypothetical protein MBLNU459_g6567t1 [Dothideomycetes sp. NU459]